VLTGGPPYSFVDRDMLIRHFGHGVGHLRYERQQEIKQEVMAVDSDSDGDDNILDAEIEDEIQAEGDSVDDQGSDGWMSEDWEQVIDDGGSDNESYASF
jgi:hypothetical protein